MFLFNAQTGLEKQSETDIGLPLRVHPITQIGWFII